jgi:hypothetical protein
MNDDTRKLLKVFGVVVTDSEAEAEKLAGIAGQLSAGSSKEEAAQLLKDSAELCRELSTRWQEITARVFQIQSRLQTQLTEAANRLQGAKQRGYFPMPTVHYRARRTGAWNRSQAQHHTHDS